MRRRARIATGEERTISQSTSNKPSKARSIREKIQFAIAGLFITGLVTFRRRDRHHEHHVVSVKSARKKSERAKRSALGGERSCCSSDRIDSALSPRRIYRPLSRFLDGFSRDRLRLARLVRFTSAGGLVLGPA
jgi:hypothetical protein